MTKHYDPDEIAAVRARTSLPQLIGRYLPLKRAGREYVARCPFHAEKTPSFTINARKGFFHCFGCGAHGDAIAFLMRIDAIAFREAVDRLRADGGIADPAAMARAAEKAKADAADLAAREAIVARSRVYRARDIWNDSTRADDWAEVRTYFASRGIDAARLPGGVLPAAIRFDPALEYWTTPNGPGGRAPYVIGKYPAIVAGIQDAEGRFAGVHLTYLQRGGRGKAEIVDPETGEILPAKKMRGNPWGGAVRLGPESAVMGYAEGIETALSIMTAQPDLPIWAALSIGNMAGGGTGRGRRVVCAAGPATASLHERSGVSTQQYRELPSTAPDPMRAALMPPAGCTEAIIFEDNDNSDPEAADCLYARAAARWAKNGRIVRRARPPAGQDFNDVIRTVSVSDGAAGQPAVLDRVRAADQRGVA